MLQYATLSGVELPVALLVGMAGEIDIRLAHVRRIEHRTDAKAIRAGAAPVAEIVRPGHALIGTCLIQKRAGPSHRADPTTTCPGPPRSIRQRSLRCRSSGDHHTTINDHRLTGHHPAGSRGQKQRPNCVLLLHFITEFCASER